MSQETPVQPSLNDLMGRFLAGQAGAHAAGLAAFDPAEVMPYEAGPVQPIDPQPAWREATAALQQQAKVDESKLTAPPHWPQLVAGHEPVVALALCAGNFPQLVRNFHQLVQSANLTALRPSAGRPTPAPQLLAWADEVAKEKRFPAALVALGALRLAKQFDAADRLVQSLEADVPSPWRAAWDNERAALAWHRGDAKQALDLWRRQGASLPVRFNRAMAELFTGDAAAARPHLAEIVAQLPETSAWHHLARLYLTLAQMR